jgi:hypothetical protein
MIRTVADFLEELKVKGAELIKKYEVVDHPVLIGDMYEGLTQDLLNRSIFEGLNLKIVGGKIKNEKGQLSGEIDCMVVEGDGDQIPFTEKYIYHFSQVIAVIQVKKSLYTGSLDDSYSNLKSVIDVSLTPEQDGEVYMMEALRDAYRSMLRTELPRRRELETYSEKEQYLYHTLLMEAYFPLRIVFGYFGFKTEYGLREGFAKFLGNQAKDGPKRGFGANSLPSLIICGKSSIIKNNGMPFALPFTKEEFYWPIYVTAADNPLYYLLEIIWTRLSYKFKISSTIFGDDFDFEPVHKYLNCKIERVEEMYGWMYNYSHFSAKTLNATQREPIPWSPQFLTEKQFVTIVRLCKEEVIVLEHNEDFKSYVEESGLEFNAFIKSLIDTGLVYERNNEIRLLTDECGTLILPDGRLCAGENKNGELSSWLQKYLAVRPDGG